MTHEKVSSDKLYRVVQKADSHINTKLNPDGSRAAIQFTNNGNRLSGPVDLIEVDRQDLITPDYIITDSKPRSLKDILIEDIFVPAAREVLYQAFTIGFKKINSYIEREIVPSVKSKVVKYAKDAKTIASGVVDGLCGKEPKAIAIQPTSVIPKSTDTSIAPTQSPANTKANQDFEARSIEEITYIVNTMRSSAVTLAACIRMLNNTVIADDGSNPELRAEIQKNLRELSSEHVMQQIEFLLDDKNKDLLDSASIYLLSVFREGYFLVNNRKVPILNYIDL